MKIPSEFAPRLRPEAVIADGATKSAGPRNLRIALIGVKFEPSYFGFDHYLSILPGKIRAQMPVGALALLAALVPETHEVEIFDENVSPLDFDRLSEFDIIGITGMIVQCDALKRVLLRLSEFPGLLVVGGPYASVDQSFFSGLCDVLFDGEADETWPQFIAAVANGEEHLSLYKQIANSDLTKLPTPRFDLLDTRAYAMATIQYSRGCPFLCEFCDIITIFGRRPRAKDPEQIIQEIEALRSQGINAAFLVDENFIGNKKLAKALLKRLIEWQNANGNCFRLTTEASIDLADEPELLELMKRANFTSVFIGIESTNVDSLKETRKVQNIRGDGLLAKVDRIRDAGLIIYAGFIVGFDSDGPDVFEKQFQFISQSNIAQAAIGTLSAIPTTPLYNRLKAEGRLRSDQPICNFQPKQITFDELRDGYFDLTAKTYTAEEYFGRIERNILSSPTLRNQQLKRTRSSVLDSFKHQAFSAILIWRLARALARDGELRQLGGTYMRLYRKWKKDRRLALPLFTFVQYAGQHWHFYKFYKDMRSDPARLRIGFDYQHSSEPEIAFEATVQT